MQISAMQLKFNVIFALTLSKPKGANYRTWAMKIKYINLNPDQNLRFNPKRKFAGACGKK